MIKIKAKIKGFARRTEKTSSDVIPFITDQPVGSYIDKDTGEVVPSNLLFLPINLVQAKLERLGKSVDAQSLAYLIGCEMNVEVVDIRKASEAEPFLLDAKYSDKTYKIVNPGRYDVDSEFILNDRAMDKLPASESFTSMFEGIFSVPTAKTPVKGNEEPVVEPDEDFVAQAEEAAEETAE